MGLTEARDAGVGGGPQPVPLWEELASLLSAPFPAEVGCYRQGVAVGVYVSCFPGPTPGLVDLLVLLFPRALYRPDSPEQQQATNMSLDLCVRLLRSSRSELRASACQKLGLLGRAEATEALLEVARGDSDECVREAAAGALENLLVRSLPSGTLADVDLVLSDRSPAGGGALGKARTDAQGYARFTRIPEGAVCCLELGEAQGIADLFDENDTGSAPLYQSFAFCHDRVYRGRIGNLEVEISPRRFEAENCFDAILRLSGADLPGGDPGERPLRPIARRGQHLYHPDCRLAAQGLLSFSRLPTGRYDLLWQVRPPRAGGHSRLLAKSAGTGSLRRLSLDAYLQVVVHSADRRLLATVEPDHGGRVVLTVAADAAALSGARVRYRLLGEEGVIQLAVLAGTGISRGLRYLHQTFAPESALSLDLELVS